MSSNNATALKAIPLDHPINSKITEEWVNVTPDLAEKFLGQNLGNRNLRPQKVKQYARDMRNGRWLTSGDAIRFDWNGRLIDGQHRCEAVIESGSTVRMLIIKGLDPHAREVIDTGAKRTGADALRFAGVEHSPALLAAIARLSIARENGYLRNALASNPPTLTNSEVIDWVESHPEVAHAAALAQRTFKSIQVQPSVWAYCLWELMQVDGPAAVEFATSTAEMRTNGKGDPRYALLDVFRRAAAGSRRKPGAAETIYITFRAWNAWGQDAQLSQLIPMRADGRGSEIPKLKAPVRSAVGA